MLLDMRPATFGGIKRVGSGPLPSVATAANIFANAPDNAVGVTLSVRGGELTITFDGATDPVGNATGVDLTEFTHTWQMSGTELRKVKAVQRGVIEPTGYYVYWGLA